MMPSPPEGFAMGGTTLPLCGAHDATCSSVAAQISDVIVEAVTSATQVRRAWAGKTPLSFPSLPLLSSGQRSSTSPLLTQP